MNKLSNNKTQFTQKKQINSVSKNSLIPATNFKESIAKPVFRRPSAKIVAKQNLLSQQILQENLKKSSPKPMRIAKYIAHSGYCSRREAENLILEGRVKVNGKIIESAAILIEDQSVKINNKLINKNSSVDLWIFHKPKGVITTNFAPQQRKTIFEILPPKMPRVVTVGRLDINTEGLILLTNNGDLARYLELPSSKMLRKYRVRVFGKINQDRLKKLEKGIVIDNIHYEPMKVKVEIEKESNSWLEIEIYEGKNREIKKVMEHLGLQVNRLIRTAFGPFSLGGLEVGALKKVRKNSVLNFARRDGKNAPIKKDQKEFFLDGQEIES